MDSIDIYHQSLGKADHLSIRLLATWVFVINTTIGWNQKQLFVCLLYKKHFYFYLLESLMESNLFPIVKIEKLIGF